MNFTYSVTEPPDGQWGSLRPDGTWTGKVGMLQEKKADLGTRQLTHTCSMITTEILYFIAITDLTVTKARSAGITFSEPIFEEFHAVFIKRPNDGLHFLAYIDSMQKNRES